jgi:hypothetical protein
MTIMYNTSQQQLANGVPGNNITNSQLSSTTDEAIASANNRGIFLTDIHTVPNSTIHVGDTFRMSVTIVNNSPDMIAFTENCSPLTVRFDKGVTTIDTKVCNIFAAKVQLASGQSKTIQIPGQFGGIFEATQSGLVHSQITFNYEIQKNGEDGRGSVTIPKTFNILK